LLTDIGEGATCYPPVTENRTERSSGKRRR
jgi:hypothetical protein